MVDVMTLLAPMVKKINEAMLELIHQDEAVIARVSGYSFEGGGKRLRPLMFCLFSEALGRPVDKKVLEMCSSFEFLHMATLLHDDIIDMAQLRRGRAAAHLAFGVPEAVLSGDYLLAKAAALGAESDSLSCVKIMSAVTMSLSLGELVQLGARRQVNLSEEEYFKIIYCKTAALMEGLSRAGALLAKAEEKVIAAAAGYGRRFGLAFQIVDDILDYQGDEAALGKSVGHDLDEGKITLPFIRAREGLSGAKRKRLCQLAGHEDISASEHEEIAALVLEGKGVESSRLKADELIREAVAALGFLPRSLACAHLEALAFYTIARDH